MISLSFLIIAWHSISTMADSGETQPLLSEEQLAKHRKSTPLPKRQVAVLAFLLLAEPVTSQCIYPFINQVQVLILIYVVFLLTIYFV